MAKSYIELANSFVYIIAKSVPSIQGGIVPPPRGKGSDQITMLCLIPSPFLTFGFI